MVFSRRDLYFIFLEFLKPYPPFQPVEKGLFWTKQLFWTPIFAFSFKSSFNSHSQRVHTLLLCAFEPQQSVLVQALALRDQTLSQPLRATEPQHFVCGHSHSALDTNLPTTASRGPAGEPEEKPGWHFEYQGPALDCPPELWEPHSGDGFGPRKARTPPKPLRVVVHRATCY